ncbi:MAG: GspH/FimT family pseudopilin [Giesbergeria sp.]
MSRRFRATGFTLLELLVVLVLAGISAAVVGSGAQSFMDRARYHQAVRDVASRLSQARALCVQQGKSITVAYEPQARQLLVQGQPPLVIPQSLEVQWLPLPPDPKAVPASGQPVFVFNADGGAKGGQFSVARGGQGVQFRVSWLLGTVEQVAVAGRS